MKPDYGDITLRINEPPKWYTPEGFPRYDEFKPREISIYADWSLLFKIACQSCGTEFLVGEDLTKMDIMQTRIDPEHTERKFLDENGEMWISSRLSLYMINPKVEDENDNYRFPTLEELVKNFHYGDPPAHGCVGDTMNSIPIQSIEVWDLRHGQVLKTDANGKTTGVIETMGKPARITELEGLNLTPDWMFE